jgi:hypothetical protein
MAKEPHHAALGVQLCRNKEEWGKIGKVSEEANGDHSTFSKTL